MNTSGALSGIRVIDLGRILAAPFASQLLADLGAEVIKIERPETGDDSRHYGPPFLHDSDGNALPDSAFFVSCNRNKRSVSVDYSIAEGADLIRNLASSADVFIENFRSGVLAKYGIDYATLRVLNPALVYCSVTGFGQDGPYAARPGYDGIFQAMCGMMSTSGLPDGVAGGGPMKSGVSIVDIVTGLYAANAIQAALRQRDKTGKGQHIDIALLDCGLASLSHIAENFLVSGIVPERRGNGGFGGVPSQAFSCADRDIFVIASNNKQFGALCRVLNKPELIDDQLFRDEPDRIQNRVVLLDIIANAFRGKNADEWLAALDAADVPCSPINDMPGVFENPQIRHRRMLHHVEHEEAGLVPILRNPIVFSATPVTEYRAPQRLGADTDDVLEKLLGYDQTAISELRIKSVI